MARFYSSSTFLLVGTRGICLMEEVIEPPSLEVFLTNGELVLGYDSIFLAVFGAYCCILKLI